MYNMQLWETSGHAANYKENMFVFEVCAFIDYAAESMSVLYITCVIDRLISELQHLLTACWINSCAD
jgi:threonyl-tRNA synthetase